ncbi:MAG: aryl-sulfate sulfotransferase [Pseudomonadota bacterium]
MRSLRTIAPILSLLVASCAADPGPVAPEDTPAVGAEIRDVAEVVAPPVIGKLAAYQNPANALSWFVEWETDVATPTWLRVDCGPDYQQVFESKGGFTHHAVFVMGLFEGADCALEVRAEAGGLVTTGGLSIADVGPVPETFPALKLIFLAEDLVFPGWTAWSLSDIRNGGPLRIFLVDAKGRYRWLYFGDDSVKAEAGVELQAIDGGLLVAAGGPEMFLGWDGIPFWEAPFKAHHDMRLSPFNEDHLLYLWISKKNCPTSEHTLNEYDRVAGEKIWTWRICEHYTPPNPYDGWSHVNTIEPFPGERAVLLSVRNQDLLMRVDRDSGEIDWTLGWGGDFTMAPEDLFLRQHAPQILDNGEILLFDNGLAQKEANRKDDDPAKVRPVSRVIQLALSFHEDGSPDAAAVTWEYLDPDLFAYARSEADRLPNGNTLITYSQLAPHDDSWLREVTEDQVTVWELRSPYHWSTYRAERIEPVYGEIRSTP